jgi:hypothetical protein
MSFRDPRPDPSISRALRRVGADDPASARELAALRRRILEQADPLLRRRRHQSAWWEYAVAWRRTLVPVALTAAAVAMVGILNAPRRPIAERLVVGERTTTAPELLDAVANRVTSGDLLDLIVSGSGTDARANASRRDDTSGAITSKGSAQ